MRVVIVGLLLTACSFDPAAPGDDDGITSVDAAAGFDPASCPSSYEIVAGLPTRYRKRSSSTFRDAHYDCKDDLLGATHLVHLDDAAEGIALREYMTTGFWTGGIQRPDQQDPNAGWFAIVGGPLPDLWEPTKPNEDDQPEANIQNAAKYQATGIDDDVAGETHQYICECDGRGVDPVVESYIP
jgi:hypothetical protein